MFVTEGGGTYDGGDGAENGCSGRRGGKDAFPIHPHMLRHACGYRLANDGHDTRALQHYLGHKNIQHTVRYTELAPDRFKNFWRGSPKVCRHTCW